uniref:Uncharacterized protein n=1 Tax=Chromera velia CCMP2878 TaxID=1169474 RepID=A0A0G4HZG4_9ALVE|eukprot:Cvel_9693.t1-p1 / transcript=Cvel_9693.t1 / gene=Cvel_9693 / organism=Chromera_velia_CCMP2878 / gene_product=hypothetical protein / transcript_product=hypothetical protein / location=Cvel_scaffold565:12325-16134(+) / protein_length=321 / sequence_SO=supercontig / SO=protein_coding / is_pseudo=false
MLNVVCLPGRLKPKGFKKYHLFIPLFFSISCIVMRMLALIVIGPEYFGLDPHDFHPSVGIFTGDLTWLFKRRGTALQKSLDALRAHRATVNVSKVIGCTVFLLSLVREYATRLRGFWLSMPGIGVCGYYWKLALIAVPIQLLGILFTTILGRIGMHFLLALPTMADVILNATALVFINELDNLFFEVLNVLVYQFKPDMEFKINIPRQTKCSPRLVNRAHLSLMMVTFTIVVLHPFILALAGYSGVPPISRGLAYVTTFILEIPLILTLILLLALLCGFIWWVSRKLCPCDCCADEDERAKGDEETEEDFQDALDRMATDL